MKKTKQPIRDKDIPFMEEIEACCQCFDCGQPRGPDTLVGICYNPNTDHRFIPDVRRIPWWCPLRKKHE